MASDLAFPEIVDFERNAGVGGVWDKTSFGGNNIDPDYPDFEGANESVGISDPEKLYKKTPFPKELESQLEASSLKNPVKVPYTENADIAIKNQWRSSAACTGLFTNVINRFIQYSFEERIGDELKEINTRYKHVPNLQSSDDVGDYVVRTGKNNDLEKYIRFNTNVEKLLNYQTINGMFCFICEHRERGCKVLKLI